MSYRNIQIIYLILDELFVFYSICESLILNKFFLFIAVLGVCCRPGFSLAAESGTTLVVLLRLLIVVASLVESAGSRARRLQ